MVNDTVRLWLEDASSDDKLLFRTFDPRRRDIVTARLEALLRLESGGITVGEAGRLAGLTRNAFHVLRGRWSADRSLASIAPFAGRRARGAAVTDGAIATAILDGGVASREIEVAQRLLLDRPDLSNGTLGRMLAEKLADGSHTNAMTRLMQRVRRNLRLQPEAIRSTYGRSLIVDHSAIALLIDGDRGPECAVASFVLERSSGLLLASRISSRDGAAAAFRDAVDVAVAAICGSPLDFRVKGEAKITIVMPPGVGAPGVEHAGREPGVAHEYIGHGTRRFGARIISTIGARIGRIRLVPRFTADGTGLPRIDWGHYRDPLNLADANEIFERERAAWNAAVMPRLKAAQLTEGVDVNGGISRSLRVVADELGRVDGSG